jgi:hypothetical protein
MTSAVVMLVEDYAVSASDVTGSRDLDAAG